MEQLESVPEFTSPAFARDIVLSPTLRINERVKALWAEGETVYHFGFGESRFPVHSKLQAVLAENAHRKGYLPVQGLAELREAIAAYDGRLLHTTISPDQVIVGPGSKALIYALQMALAGDLLLPTPSWVSYAPQAKLLGKPVHFVRGTAVDGYELTLETLDKAVQQADSDTKILLINSPNNPAGYMFTPEFLQSLADYCRQNRIVVISDEIYAKVAHGFQPHVSLAEFYPEGTIVVGGLSKHLSLGGWRLGKAVIPKEQAALMPALRTIASEIWSTTTGPVQYTAVTAYSNDPEIEAYIAECTQIHAARTQHIWGMFDELGMTCPQPQGGFYLIPNFDRWREPLARRGVHTSDDLAHYMLDEYHIASLPGSAFGVPSAELSLRIATSYVDMETDEAASNLLAAWRQTPDKEEFISQHQPQMTRALTRFQQFISEVSS